MNKIPKINLINWIWEFPQTMLGFILAWLLLRKDPSRFKVIHDGSVFIVRSPHYHSGVSLGRLIFLKWYNYIPDSINHEKGHSKQSLLLGPLYLLVIGLPSMINNIIHKIHNSVFSDKWTRTRYYEFYTEKWADRLGGVIRKIKSK